MKTISDLIEEFLKGIITESQDGMVEIQRSTIAERFDCVPSQINYVISTRFTIDNGFLIESKRGGGGYIRIQKLLVDSHADLYEILSEIIGDSTSNNTALLVLDRLISENLISTREYMLIRALFAGEIFGADTNEADRIRANIMKICLGIVFSEPR
jgi:transcriptional regulator CtsR